MPEPFWRPPPDRYPGTLPDKADVVVIGGGIAGLSLGWHLAQRRIDTVVLERNRIGSGASGRNAGLLLAGVASSYAEAVGTYGRDRAREIWELTNENHDRMIEALAGQQVGHRRLGSATLPAGEDEIALLIESEQLLNEDGFAARWDGVRLLNPRDGEVNPAALLAALARRLDPRVIREGINVTALTPRRHGVVVGTPGGECEAGVVILATNAYTPLLSPQVKIRATRAQMLATEPESKSIADVPVYSNFGYRYWRQLPTGEVLIGGWRDTTPDTELTFEAEPTREIQERLDQALVSLGVSARVSHRWAGIMGFTESGLPFAGPVEGSANVYVCAGFTGHGMGFAFVTARRVAQML
ncbi:MAG TPA: FAD-binding oxidoreductase [Candidatus Udaeobacter sp.]|nr:FAD-binding oxidoreductase [Candidatus Udaeobacter sp.]